MYTFKVITSVLIILMMLLFIGIWICARNEKGYVFVWVLLEAIYILSLIAIWG